MTKPKTNPAAIGVFIAGAIVILFASLVLLGSGRLFKKTKDFLLTFREPVTGLDVGAPVKLMGVTVGNVKEIFFSVGDSTNTMQINVVIEIDVKNTQSSFKGHQLDLNDRTRFERMVRQLGLRGQLDVLSMLSGQLYIALDLFPGKEGFQLNREQEHGYWEIPTLPSTKRQLMQSLVTSLNNLTQLDFEGISEELKSLLVDLRSDLGRLQLGSVGTNLTQALAEVRARVADPQLKSAITNLNGALAEIRQLGQGLNAQVGPLLTQADADLQKAGATFEEATKTLRQLQAQVEPNSALSRELIRTLEEAGTTLNALRQLAQELQRNPSSLITGKKEPKP